MDKPYSITRNYRTTPPANNSISLLCVTLISTLRVEIRIPKSGKSSYAKLGRRGGDSDYPIAAAAAWVDASNGTVADARIAVTGVSSKPYVATASCEAIIGSDGSADAISSAASHATDGVVVLEDLYGTVAYRTHLASVYVQRALERVLA